MEQNNRAKETKKSDPKIGLALSGGGFRASIFHLGVIRRLEELGLMKNVAVISAVSGGSIIAAYYVIEMERRLRENLHLVAKKEKTIDQLRLEAFPGIATDFFAGLDHNPRCRAMLYPPFFHPLQWLRSFAPGYSRSNLMQTEYDKWFYQDNPLDQLPSVTKRNIDDESFVFGPKLIINTTSLLDGQRVSFFRQPIGRFKEFDKVDKNTLKLSEVVGASSCVPGAFPPVLIGGEKYVDGGVSDNQGVEALLDEGRQADHTNDSPPDTEEKPFDILLVSDASGQMELLPSIKDSALSVLNRTMEILQFQVRKKIIRLLGDWKEKAVETSKQKDAETSDREFAFVHLFLNLKDRSDVPRVPSEYIAPLGRIRTDLDQFSLVEREALMFHGYTLIDAQIRRHCPNLTIQIEKSHKGPVPMTWPPLFSCEQEQFRDHGKQEGLSFVERRNWIKKELVLGKHKMLTLRSAAKYPKTISAVILLTWILPITGFFLLGLPYITWLTTHIGAPVLKYLQGCCPQWVQLLFSQYLGIFQWPLTEKGAMILVCLGALIYCLSFLMYLIVQKLVKQLDLAMYAKLTGKKLPTMQWEEMNSGAVKANGTFKTTQMSQFKK